MSEWLGVNVLLNFSSIVIFHVSYFIIYKSHDDEGKDFPKAKKLSHPNYYTGTGQPVISLPVKLQLPRLKSFLSNLTFYQLCYPYWVGTYFLKKYSNYVLCLLHLGFSPVDSLLITKTNLPTNPSKLQI